LLTTKGARSGKPREAALLYLVEGDDIILMASHGGKPQHPGWYYNLKTNPEVDVLCHGCSGTYLAREAMDSEHDRLWEMALELYSGFAPYKKRAGARQIPLIVLTPK
jgi:deazaflavin-dependent oxidoreductase (nitroreductase family)